MLKLKWFFFFVGQKSYSDDLNLNLQSVTASIIDVEACVQTRNIYFIIDVEVWVRTRKSSPFFFLKHLNVRHHLNMIHNLNTLGLKPTTDWMDFLSGIRCCTFEKALTKYWYNYCLKNHRQSSKAECDCNRKPGMQRVTASSHQLMII